MRQILINMTTLPLWASPNSSVYDMMLRSEDRSAVRRASALQPVYSLNSAIEDPPARPVPPLPQDVPVHETQDVPVREPMDVPPLKPEKPIKPLMPKPNPDPGSTP